MTIRLNGRAEVVAADQHHDVVAEEVMLPQTDDGKPLHCRDQCERPAGATQCGDDVSLGGHVPGADPDHDEFGTAFVDQFEQFLIAQRSGRAEFDGPNQSGSPSRDPTAARRAPARGLPDLQ